MAPLSLSALLLTLVLLFGLQGEQIMRQPLVIALLAVPILIQVYFNAGLAYWLNRHLGVAWCVAGPSALIGASNRARRWHRSSAFWWKCPSCSRLSIWSAVRGDGMNAQGLGRT